MKLHRKLSILLALGFLALGGLPTHAAEGKRDLDTILTEQRIKRMTTELTLTDEQKEKVHPLIAEEIKYFRTLRDNQSITEEDRVKKEKEFRESSKPKYKAILSEEQFGKWEKSQEKKPRKPKAQ